MAISVFDLFSIGIGPSSSHTVGPMKAACAFISKLHESKKIKEVTRIKIELFGSLAFTGKGHGTDFAILLGLEGNRPDTVEPDLIRSRAKVIVTQKTVRLLNQYSIQFDYLADFIFNYKELLPLHTNGMRFSAYDREEQEIFSKVYYSIGGGFLLEDDKTQTIENSKEMPFNFSSAKTLLALCKENQLSISNLMLVNESSLQPEAQVKERLLHIANVMQACINKGCMTSGTLPGGLNINRRAPGLYEKLQIKGQPKSHEHIDSMAWLNLFAIAVNEENAAGGRVVTAPTNGAAGIIPAVLQYYLTFFPNVKKENDIVDFLLTAGAIAILYKKGASISGAEVGCQGEVGAACSMAAGALTAVLGGNLDQIENAAEIAMEHHLGLTCDPIKGLVQIPCIERNAMGAVKAVNAARLALLGDGQHFVSLDKVIATMKQTGKDMLSIYKETSQGGLAVNLPEC